ncbi:MAG: ImmA/IrrE family metallo-endopeptidase [Bacteroidota bacterium]
MSETIRGVNPRMLRWARELAGVSVADVAHRIKKSEELITAWESGAEAPTYAQLEQIACHYRRPVALFFFPEPPEERDPVREFRTLPDFERDQLERDTRYALRQAEAMRLSLQELNDGVNPSPEKIFRDITLTSCEHPRQLAEMVRDYLGVSMTLQASWKSSDDAFQQWRTLIQNKGIFVFKRSLKQRDISGFCLMDSEFPLIYINNSTSSSRQSFTLFHELAHILLRTSGVTKQNDRFIDMLPRPEKEIEVFANQFASECLVPSADFNAHFEPGAYDDETLARLAQRYRVSREVILRNYLNRGLVDRDFYELKAEEWTRQYEESRGEGSGGNYYATQAVYLGDKYLQLAFRRYYEGRFDVGQLADYLNVKASSVAGLEQFVLKGAID